MEESDEFEPLAEEKYVRRCGQDSVRSFIISNSLEELEKKSDRCCAKIWLEILIESESPSVVFDAICDLEKLQIDLDWKYFQKKLKNLADSSDIIELSTGPTDMTSKYCASIAQELFKICRRWKAKISWITYLTNSSELFLITFSSYFGLKKNMKNP